MDDFTNKWPRSWYALESKELLEGTEMWNLLDYGELNKYLRSHLICNVKCTKLNSIYLVAAKIMTVFTYDTHI